MKSLFVTLLALAGLFLYAPGSLHAQPEPDAPIATSLAEQPNTKTLNAALRAADLTTSLKETGDFLLLAPTDAAFASLPEGVVEALLQPDNKDKLRELLLFHLVAETEGAYTATTTDKLKDTEAKALTGIPC
ncbi:MAG: fasciclin domain-containing protein, partial [Lewinella sp.]